MQLLERLFEIAQRHSTVRRETLAGVTTFMALSYIIFVQPAVMGAAGVPRGGALVATCVASAVACLLMAFLANYPIALAPAMGHNFYFAYFVCLKSGYAWQEALAAVFIGGAVFVALSFFGFRARIMEFIPDGLKRAIAGGIGLLITLVGLEYAGIVMPSAGVYVELGTIKNKFTLLALFGLAVTLVLLALEVRGAILYGMAATALVGCAVTRLGYSLLDYSNLQSYDTLWTTESLFALDFAGLFASQGFLSAMTIILTFLFLDVFDTIGTLVGVSERAGLLQPDGTLPKARWALFSDASGTVVGSLMGTSTVTSYVESAAGVQAGGRTGFASVVTAALLLLSIVLYPLLGIISQGHTVLHEDFTVTLYPVIAPALIVVGAMMLKSLKLLNWTDPTEFIPAFLTLVVMPFTVSITDGIAFGFISCSLLKFVTGRSRDVPWGFHVLSGALLLRYIFLT